MEHPQVGFQVISVHSIEDFVLIAAPFLGMGNEKW
jgi:hypothetical protein